MPAYLFYPRRANGVSLTFIAEAAKNDAEAMALAAEIAADHDCVGVFVWEPASTADGKDRFVGEVGSVSEEARTGMTGVQGASASA
ncbi:hypothetical protein B7G68_16970 [Caulobacter segnis]|uniref:TSSC4 tumor suppressing subtransferable candidate 4 n=2 Tax=Caulobacter segnis TaxID=88688 RepID=D5VMM5_CAUST|nr:hypothetical protein [Caulobacter segnis]ADG11748.1 TSSC4; tumor suppressing subtransferable candidate 4 [Caulobacter segnis ATCC 21756]AVQ03389.1 hypothetical protein B7G68_16970 [Caulobacter segnis]